MAADFKIARFDARRERVHGHPVQTYAAGWSLRGLNLYHCPHRHARCIIPIGVVLGVFVLVMDRDTRGTSPVAAPDVPLSRIAVAGRRP